MSPPASSGTQRIGRTGGGNTVDKKFGASTQTWLAGSGGGPSQAADTTASQRLSVGYSDAETYTPGDDQVLSPRPAEYEGECGCSSPGNCGCPVGDGMMAETVLRQFIRETMLGAFGVASTDLGESELVDEDEDEQCPNTTEFAAIGGGAAGTASISGYSLPLGQKGPTYGGKKSQSSRKTKSKK